MERHQRRRPDCQADRTVPDAMVRPWRHAGGRGLRYVLLPGKSADDTAAYAAAPPIQIVQNDAAAQAVTHVGLGSRR